MEHGDGKLVAGRTKNPRWVPKIRCNNFGEFTFSRAVQSHINSENPCTNTLEFCPRCPRDPVPKVFWTYRGGDDANPKGMLHHFRTKHNGIEMGDELLASTKPSDAECAAVRKDGQEPPKKRNTKPRQVTAVAGVATGLLAGTVTGEVAAVGASTTATGEREGAATGASGDTTGTRSTAAAMQD
jgi:hypothetical protein